MVQEQRIGQIPLFSPLSQDKDPGLDLASPVALLLLPGQSLGEEVLGHLRGEVILQGVGVHKGGTELLSRLNLINKTNVIIFII